MKFIKEFFSFSNSEIRGLVIMLFIILSLITWRFILSTGSGGFKLSMYYEDDPGEFIPINPPEKGAKDNVNLELTSLQESGKLFVFDPNTIAYSDLLSLGFTEYVAKRILKYRSKGGRFYARDDLYKIYCIDSSLVFKLKDYIEIIPQNNFSGYENDVPLEPAMTIIDLNKADTTQLKQVPGIGSVLSARIIKYRDLLGGFYSKKQLKEVYGMDDSLIIEISSVFNIDTNCIHKINLNDASVNELGKHPYITFRQAKAILSYRQLRGPFESKNQLIEYYLLSEMDFLKLAPYLALK